MADGESSKNSSGPTGLEDIVLRPDDDKVPIEIDPKTGRAKDPNKAKFVTFLGSLAQKEVSILTPQVEGGIKSTEESDMGKDLCK